LVGRLFERLANPGHGYAAGERILVNGMALRALPIEEVTRFAA
jgi:hypothetical protein